MFFRAYPAAYHNDFVTNLKASALSKIPVGSSLCFGDAHPDNFGFLELEGSTRYAYNDLDDSGHCPVALDALRYVTAVHLKFDKDLAKVAADRYVKVLRGAMSEADATQDVARVRADHAPLMAEHRAAKLKELVADGHLVLGDGVVPVFPSARSAVSEAVATALPGLVVLDVVEVEREVGGSGGLSRYSVLVRRDASLALLELKEAATPGVDRGLDAKPMSQATRLASLKKDLWGVTLDAEYFYVKTLGKTFLLRDRLAKAPLDLAELDKKDRERAVEAQAAILAMLHKGTLEVVSDGEAETLRTWLEDSSDALAHRWMHAYE
jgi:hypothetical protein